MAMVGVMQDTRIKARVCTPGIYYCTKLCDWFLGHFYFLFIGTSFLSKWKLAFLFYNVHLVHFQASNGSNWLKMDMKLMTSFMRLSKSRLKTQSVHICWLIRAAQLLNASVEQFEENRNNFWQPARYVTCSNVRKFIPIHCRDMISGWCAGVRVKRLPNSWVIIRKSWICSKPWHQPVAHHYNEPFWNCTNLNYKQGYNCIEKIKSRTELLNQSLLNTDCLWNRQVLPNPQSKLQMKQKHNCHTAIQATTAELQIAIFIEESVERWTITTVNLKKLHYMVPFYYSTARYLSINTVRIIHCHLINCTTFHTSIIVQP